MYALVYCREMVSVKPVPGLVGAEGELAARALGCRVPACSRLLRSPSCQKLTETKGLGFFLFIAL